MWLTLDHVFICYRVLQLIWCSLILSWMFSMEGFVSCQVLFSRRWWLVFSRVTFSDFYAHIAHTQHTQPGQESGQIFIWDENGGENNQRAYVRPHSKVAKKQKPCIFFQLDFTSKGDALGQFSWFWLQCYLQFFKTKKTILPTHLGHLPDLQLHLEHIICDVFILWYS